MQRKYWLSSVLFLAMGASLLACQPAKKSAVNEALEVSNVAVVPDGAAVASGDSNASEIDLDTEVVATRPWKIAFVIKEERYEESPDDAFWPVTWRGAKQAGEDFGVNVELAYVTESCSNTSQCVEAQIKLVLDLLNSGEMDGMVISAKDANRLVPIVEKVIDADIPVITMDSTVNTNKILSFVTIDNVAAGKMMGEWLADELDPNSNVLILEGEHGQHNAMDRRNGFLAGLQRGNVNVLDSKSANWYRDVSEEITTDWISEFSDIDAILAANDDMALGALTATQKAGLKDVVVTGYDATGDAIESIRAGDLVATVDQVPNLQARAAVQLMVRHLESGETFPPRVFIPDTQLVSQDNVEQYLQERQ